MQTIDSDINLLVQGIGIVIKIYGKAEK